MHVQACAGVRMFKKAVRLRRVWEVGCRAGHCRLKVGRSVQANICGQHWVDRAWVDGAWVDGAWVKGAWVKGWHRDHHHACVPGQGQRRASAPAMLHPPVSVSQCDCLDG
eukprot:353438-Chlamydomonas_euryale.AAC.16